MQQEMLLLQYENMHDNHYDDAIFQWFDDDHDESWLNTGLDDDDGYIIHMQPYHYDNQQAENVIDGMGIERTG